MANTLIIHDLDPKRNPWDVQPRETAKAFRAFKIFLDIGEDRNIQKVANILGCSWQNVRRWYDCWQWRERAAAYEGHLVEQEYAELRKERRKAMKQQVKIAKGLMNVGQAMMNDWLYSVQEAEEHRQAGDPDWKEYLPDMKVPEVLNILELGQKTGRLVFGEPTEITEQQHSSTEPNKQDLLERMKKYDKLFEDDEL